MNPTEMDAWKQEMLERVLEAMAESAEIRERLVFKGARVLRHRLSGVARGSLDIDSNLLPTAFPAGTELQLQATKLRRWLHECLTSSFASERVERYRVVGLTVKAKPRDGHPRGWTMLVARIRVDDLSRDVRNFPALMIEMASPEPMTLRSMAPLVLERGTVNAHTLERITGEKLRAFLSSLPAYRSKANKPHAAIRAKDIYDLATIHGARPPSDHTDFWQTVGAEFALTCQARFVDCAGWSSFAAGESATKSQYEDATIIPTDISFDKAWAALEDLVRCLEGHGLFPMAFPFPQAEDEGRQ